MPREFRRSDRVGAQIQREVAELMRTRVRDPELGLVTLNDVELSRDLAVARLYVSFLGSRLTPANAIKRLADCLPELRRELGKRIRIRVLPELRFVHDDSIERGMRMDSLIEGLVRDDARAEDGSSPPE